MFSSSSPRRGKVLIVRDSPAPGAVEQLKRALAVCKKDIRIYYSKGPVLIFGILFPAFLFLAFSIGRQIPTEFLVSGLVGMTLFFTSTSVVPVILPWETRMGTMERLISAPISLSAIILGDVLASFLFGAIISATPIAIGLAMGVRVIHLGILALGILLGAFCFSSLAAILSTPPTDIPANVMMLSTLVKFPLVFISGVFIPLEAMPTWSRLIASFSPLTYLTDLTRYSIQGLNQYPIYMDLGFLATFAAIFLTVAIKLHERNIPKRLWTGVLSRFGFLFPKCTFYFSNISKTGASAITEPVGPRLEISNLVLS